MAELVHVRPLPGKRVRLEERPRELLPEGGTRVRETQYWLRREQDGEVEITRGDPQPAPARRARAEKE